MNRWIFLPLGGIIGYKVFKIVSPMIYHEYLAWSLGRAEMRTQKAKLSHMKEDENAWKYPLNPDHKVPK